MRQGTDSIERVGLAARATLPPQPPGLEHPLTLAGQEACETGTERTGALDRERSPTSRVRLDQSESVRVAVAARGDIRLEHDRSAEDVHDRDRMYVSVRVDTDDVVQLICEQP